MDNDDTPDQMDHQPATPTRTVAASAPDCNHDPSPDPPSTRPNPFDDSDHSARKRRRTSGSASPPPPIFTSTSTSTSPSQATSTSTSASTTTSATATATATASQSASASASGPASADAKPTVKDLSTSTGAVASTNNNTGTNTNNTDHQANNAVSPAAEQTELLHTPKTPTDSAKSGSPTPLSSSKVTINLRKAADPELESKQTKSSSPTVDQDPLIVSVSAVTSHGQQDMVMEKTSRTESGRHTPQMSDSASPPVELIAISDNENGESDDEMAFSVDDGATGILSGESLPRDPTQHFPYIQDNEDPSQPLHRFIHHFKTDSSVTPEAVVLLQAWVQDYLRFASTAEKSTVIDSRQTNKRFWVLFPEAMLQLLIRSPELVKSPDLRHAMIGMYSSFACLAACMVSLDLIVLREFLSTGDGTSSPQAELYSAKYLQQLHDIIVTYALSTNGNEEGLPGSEWVHDDVGSFFLGKLQSSQGGSVAALSQLVASVTTLASKFPKLTDNLAAISKILGSCMRESVRIIPAGGDQAAQAQNKLEMGNTAWAQMSACLELVIEKHVTQLSVDTATTLIQALTEILKWTLRGEHKSAVEAVQLCMEKYPDLPCGKVFEAIAWQWRLSILGRLIRSGQMQLRVMAISKLCTDLVTTWKCAVETIDDGSNRFLRYLGECLLETRLVDYIFGPNCHPEIIVEGSNILGFLVVTKLYNQEHTDRLWQGLTLCQDPRVAEALVRMITSIANLFDYDGLLGWCQKFRILPLEAFSPAMRTLWDNVMNELILKCQSDRQAPSFEPYNLCLRLLREASVCSAGSQVADPDLQLAAMQKLRELVNCARPDDLDILYLSCLDDVAKKSPTALGSLWCLSMAMRGNMPSEVQNLTENHDLAKLVVEELAHAVLTGQQAGAFAVISGTPNAPRRELISNIIQFQPSALNNDLGTTLLDIIVGPKSPCAEDRKAGWLIITNVMRKATMKNAFLQTCFSKYLPGLAASCFSDGMLEFVRERVLYLAADDGDFALDDDESLSHSGCEQLWRIILEAEDSLLVSRAISTLAVDLYLESGNINSYSVCRSKKVHRLLVNRCLAQMKQAAKKLNGSTESIVGDDDESMVIVETTEELQQQERVFRRSLQLMRFFLEKYQAHDRFAVADFRPLISPTVGGIEGEPACLQYQAFDNQSRSDVKALDIGLQNTVGSLLTRLKIETGFDNFHLYYRGKQLLPKKYQATKSLEELNIRDGFILVRREEDCARLAGYLKPGSSPMEIEILGYFQDLWEYLGMDEKLAEEVYDFLVKLPADGQFMLRFDSEHNDYSEVFLKGQAFKALYGIHGLSDYLEAAERSASTTIDNGGSTANSATSYEKAILKGLGLIVSAIRDPEMLDEMPITQHMRIAGSFLQVFVRLFTEAAKITTPLELSDDALPEPCRLVDILAKAEGDMSDMSLILVESTCTAVLRVGSTNKSFWNATVESTPFLDYLKNFLLKDPRKAVRQTIVELIEDIPEPETQILTPESGHSNSGREEANSISFSICTALTQGLPLCLDYPSQPEEYFRAVLFLVDRVSATNPQGVDIEHLAVVTRDLLLKHTCIEVIDRPEVTDPITTGLVSVLHLCVQNNHSLNKCTALDESVVSRLFWRHLFPRKRRGDGYCVPRVILDSDTRKKLYDVIFLCVRYDLNSFVHILETLNGLVPFYMDESDDPYLYDLPYQFDRSRAVRAPCGYVGLRNLSNTCYLNSLLTQLFMNTQFRSFIMSTEVQDAQDSQQLLFFTQKLFGYMQESYQRFVDPFDVVTSIKTYDDAPIDIHSQMDVDEFYNLLFDRWEGQLPRKDEKKHLRSFFGGQLVQQVKSKECEHISERLEPFSAIQCDIKGKVTLEESLQAYVDGEVMEGENKYKCSTCDRHVDAVKRSCLKDVPDNVIFHLKRFDFNLRTLQRRKINDYFTFPQMLDIAPYTVEYLNAADGATGSDIFELVGVLVHSGTAESGHYYSYVRERGSVDQPRWVEFNDESVMPWDPSQMESATFGGQDVQSSMHETNGIIYDKTYSAYMLFYQRASLLHKDSQSNRPMAESHLPAVDIPPPLMEHILNENKILLRRHCLFDSSHVLFVQQCFGHSIYLGEGQGAKFLASKYDPDQLAQDDGQARRSSDPATSSHNLQNLAMEVALSHFDQVVTRAKDMMLVESFSSKLKSAVAKCYDCAFAFYDYFNMRHAAFRAIIQRNPDSDIRSFAGKTLILAAAKIRCGLPRLYHCPMPTKLMSSHGGGTESDEDWDDSESPPSVLQGIIRILNYLWKFFYMHIRSWDEYFGTVLAFARLGDPEVSHLLGDNYLLKLLNIVRADPMTEMQPNYQRMVNNLLRRFNSKPASYTAILTLIDYLIGQLEPALSADVIVDEPQDRLNGRGPFSWTSEEVQAVLYHPDSHYRSFFTEKLLEIDQVPEATNSIIGRLVESGEELDMRVFNTLRKKIQGETTQAMDSSIRAAGRYVELSESLEKAQAIIKQVCSQACNLQQNEGRVFLDFVDLILRSRRPNEELAQPRRFFMMEVMPTWAPFLLVYGDEYTRNAAEQLINDRLFQRGGISVGDVGMEQETLDGVIRQLGIKCLIYLREVHVKRRMQLERSAAGNILRIIGSCVPLYEGSDEMSDYADDAAEFRAIQGEISSPLQRLLVDEIEDDGSDWDGSCGSSELMEANVSGLGQIIHQIHD